MKRIWTLVLAVLVAVVLIAVIARRHSPPPVAQGSLAPDFALKTLDGTPLRLSDYRGKVVLLDFWATWCTPCREEIPRFVEWQRVYGGQGLQVIGVSMDDSPAPVKKFSQDFGIDYPVTMGNPEVASSYGGILGLPVNLVISRDGRILSKHLGIADPSQLLQELTAQLAAAPSR